MWVGQDGWTSTEFSFTCLRGTVSADRSCCNINSPYYLAIERKINKKQKNNRLKRKQKSMKDSKNQKMFTFALLGCFFGR